MTKEEKIIEAWAVAMPGYTDYDERGLSNHIFKYSEVDFQKFRQFPVLDGCYIIPYSLDGIENNNGWIKIESESDLPKDNYDHWVIFNNRIELMSHVISLTGLDIEQGTITHYQPIVKPKNPVY